MSPGQKIALVAVLSLGGIIPAFSIIRVVVTSDTTKLAEISWLALWSAIESSVAVMVACLASFKVLFTQQRRRRRGGMHRDDDDAYGQGLSEEQ
ncbi:hypothetical protein PG996_004396 [Apiospora saccharicola]|uniref:Rhodopsin domain-containing protein n=1 Tax=Apiospora saccharicola TaxID=335842 RepID=A0ABR1W405_9PEZI